MNAELIIHAATKKGKTFLKNSFYTQPFKIADITEDKNDQTLHLMIMSSSPGILDNDDYKITIELDEECCVKMETQSYQRLFRMKTGAKQEMKVTMKDSSSFIFLPHPSVPHESSRFLAKNEFRLASNCFLIWGEVLTCGRKLSGEMFQFSMYHSLSRIYLLDKLIVKENLFMAPAEIEINSIGQLEGYTHQASFTCIGANFCDNAEMESIHDLLLAEKDICFGVSALAVNGFTVRLLGYKAEQLHYVLQKIAGYLTALQRKKEIIKLAYYAK